MHFFDTTVQLMLVVATTSSGHYKLKINITLLKNEEEIITG